MFHKNNKNSSLTTSKLDPFGGLLPVTFNVKIMKNMMEDSEFQQFYNTYIIKEKEQQHVWICKPGENANRGRGI